MSTKKQFEQFKKNKKIAEKLSDESDVEEVLKFVRKELPNHLADKLMARLEEKVL